MAGHVQDFGFYVRAVGDQWHSWSAGVTSSYSHSMSPLWLRWGRLLRVWGAGAGGPRGGTAQDVCREQLTASHPINVWTQRPPLAPSDKGLPLPAPGRVGLELNVESIFSSHLHCTLSKCEGTV